MNNLTDDLNINGEFDALDHIPNNYIKESINQDVYEGNTITYSDVPNLAIRNSNRMVYEAFGIEISDEQAIDWPSRSSNPVNEFECVGFIAMAFPFLFPNGDADFNQTRTISINIKEYFQHLMLYKDRRFSSDFRFRYFAMNMLMRWETLSNTQICIRKYKLNNMTEFEITEKLKHDKSFVNFLLSYNQNIRSTNNYWYARSKELYSMIKSIGAPTLFFTLSAADLFWPEIFTHLGHHYNIDNNLSQSQIIAIRRKILNDNPLEFSYFFQKRASIFIHKVLKPKFGVIDYWFHFEFQHRGSPHVHGLLWLENAPDLSAIKKNDKDEFDYALEYFDSLICTDNLNPSSDIGDTDHLDDYIKLINHFQRHTKHTKYCYKKNTAEKKCRFNFPKPLVDKSTLELNPSSNQYEFISKRNDELMNPHSRFITELWCANHDLQNIVSLHAVLTYVAKYTAKSENKSDDLNSFIKLLLNNDGIYKEFKVSTLVNKILMKNLVQRDYSAQETCFFLMGYKFFQSSRSFLTIDLPFGQDPFVLLNIFPHSNSNNTDDQPNSTQTNFSIRKRNYLDEYSNRPVKYEDWNLVKYFSKVYKVKNELKERLPGNEFVLQFKPYINSDDIEANCKKEVILNYPFRDLNSLFIESWENTLNILKSQNEEFSQSSLNLDAQLEKIYEELENESECEVEPGFLNDANQINHQFMEISKTGVSVEIPKFKLGFRDKDILHYDWSQHCKSSQVIKNHFDFLNSLKESENFENIDEDSNIILNSEQEKVINLFDKQLSDALNNNFENSKVKRVIVQGKAGSGKSTIIKQMTSRLCKSRLGPESFLLLAPTGLAALNINGNTIHSKLKIYGHSFKSLENEQLKEFQNELEAVKFIIIDEYSMVGSSMLSKIDDRLKQAKSCDKEHFGGVFI